MRNRMCGRFLLVAAGLALLPGFARAQTSGATNYAPQDPQVPLPLGSERPESGGFFVGSEFYFMHMTRAISNDQVVALRGYIDSTGFITGRKPGTYVGDGQVALSTGQLGRTTWEPGYDLFVGYRFNNECTVTLDYLHLFQARYSAGATLVPPFQQARPDLADTFLVSPVFNFPVDFAGPQFKTAFDTVGNTTTGGSNTYGIWNAASEETIKFTQRFDKADLVVRQTILETDCSRSYALYGGRFAWFWENFSWRAVSRDTTGHAGPQDQATYSNVISNRMYGPLLGCGHEFWLGNSFSVAVDATGSVLLDIVKERAKYLLGDASAGTKRGRTEFQPTPNGNLNIHLDWRPVEFIEIRLGYQAMAFFNTISSRNPVDFNYGAIDPGYNHQAFRLLHGLDFGIAFSF